MRSPAVRPYRWLAQYYDAVFGSFREPMDTARNRLLHRILPAAGSVCDLACGGGDTALEMARSGKKVYAVDLSAGMCKLAREKASAAGLPLRVIRGDMRTFRLPEPVDLITCEYDALNHVPRKEDLCKVAEAVARALKPGGHFYFDVNNRKGFRQYWCTTFWIEKPGLALVMRNGNDHARDRAWCDVEWFIREGALWRRRKERVEEVCWSGEEMRRALHGAGFDKIRTWDGGQYFKMQRGCRTIYLARKQAGRLPARHGGQQGSQG
jgi:SAM-dependent methyltransferase